jgi:hypothetical protein
MYTTAGATMALQLDFKYNVDTDVDRRRETAWRQLRGNLENRSVAENGEL